MTGINQARRGLTRNIAEDKTLITVMRYPMKTDPIGGGLVPDPFADKVPKVLTCRMPHKRKLVPTEGTSNAGFNEDLERMALFDWKNEPQTGDQFDYLGKGWEIGPVDPITYQGKIKGYQAYLKEAE